MGSDKGYSAKEIVDKAIELSDVQFNYQYSVRRAEDPASVRVYSTRARTILKWYTIYSLAEIILTDLNWRKSSSIRENDL